MLQNKYNPCRGDVSGIEVWLYYVEIYNPHIGDVLDLERMKIMILKAYNAPWKDNIDLFIEKNGILKGNIEGVFHDTVNHFFTLFYWSKV